MQVAIYPTDISDITAAPVAILITGSDFSILDSALRDVPIGLPFLIIDTTDVPSDRSTRKAWEADFSTPDGYGIGRDAWEASQ